MNIPHKEEEALRAAFEKTMRETFGWTQFQRTTDEGYKVGWVKAAWFACRCGWLSGNSALKEAAMAFDEMTAVAMREAARLERRIAELEHVVRLVASVQPAPHFGYDLDAMDAAILAARKALIDGVSVPDRETK